MINTYYIDSVGGRGGMYYYDFALCSALQRIGVDITFITCEETRLRNVPDSLDIKYLFKGIYGKKNVFIRGKNYIISLKNINRSLRNKKGIIHFHFFQIPILDYLFLFLLKKKGFRIVITAHDIIPFNARFYTAFILKRIYKIADRIIVHAFNNKEEIIKKFRLDHSCVSIIPHGNYLPFISNNIIGKQTAKQRLGVDKDTKIILFFGQIKKQKGLDYLIKAFGEVRKTIPQSILIIAGKVWKDDFSVYSKLISELALEQYVITRIEYIPDNEVSIYFSAADVVVLPYINIYQSGVLLMAYSYKKPVVATSVGGLDEVVKNGETGLLVPPKDVVKLTAKIIKMFSDEKIAEEMGKKGRKLVEEKFSWKGIAKKTKNIYMQLDSNISN